MVDASAEPRASVVDAEPTARFSLRIAPQDLAAGSSAFGAPLPDAIGDVVSHGPRRALCLGPDEWLIKTEPSDAAALARSFADVAEPHSLVDVSVREITLRLSGPDVLAVLATGCPRDLRRFAKGQGMRTVFDGVTVVLWRVSETDVELDVWRSFAPHIMHHLTR